MERVILPPGSFLKDRYVIDRLLGAGGFGNVYRAWDPLLDCSVAIKEYRENVQKFLTEARISAGLRFCPNIVYVYDFFEEAGAAYIVMEYLQGEKLKDLLKRKDRLPLREALGIMYPLLNALKAVHGAGLLHRDVAPDNIWILRDGTVKLFDFGCAGKCGIKRQDVEVKEGYSPPEQYDPEALQGPESDIYAASAVLYRMLTGREPQPAPERFHKDRMTGEIRKKLPSGRKLKELLLVGMCLKPERRVPSAGVFEERLRKAEREERRGKKLPGFLFLGAGLMLFLTAAIGLSKTEKTAAETVPEAEQEQEVPAEPGTGQTKEIITWAETEQETEPETEPEKEPEAEQEKEQEAEQEKEQEAEQEKEQETEPEISAAGNIVETVPKEPETQSSEARHAETQRPETQRPEAQYRETEPPQAVWQEAPTVPDPDGF